MSAVAVRTEGLGKRYSLAGTTQPYGSLRESLSQFAARPLRRARGRARPGASRTELWALRDVSFEVKYGEVLGIIGRNGAGKSTLLKLLSRITRPSEGRFTISSRVASLLEVGTGFHRELTGRENVYMNGAILGMTRSEINRKFDEIVAFAELERFIDTQIKYYSSGMSVRLAFAVAAHLDPEVLIVDEVLAVGDAAFQRRCLNKLEISGQEGRAVLFVSHAITTVTRLCERAVFLERGRLVSDGPVAEVTNEYLGGSMGTTAHRTWPDPETAPGNEVARLRGVRVCGEDGETTSSVDIRRPLGIEVDFDVLLPGQILIPSVALANEYGGVVCLVADQSLASRDRPRRPGRYRSTVWFPGNLLAEGSLLVNVKITGHTLHPSHVEEREAVTFQVIDTIAGDSARGHFAGYWPGVFRPLLPWTTVEIGPARAVDPAGQEMGRRARPSL